MKRTYQILVLFISTLLFSSLFAGCCVEPSGQERTDYQIWGIDLSRHQKRVNWDKLIERHSPHFVFLKATEGTLIVDPTYHRHAEQLNERGVLWGAYHFFGHRTSGKEQAQAFIKVAKLRKGNLIPVLDIERHRFMTDPKQMVRQAKAFCKEIKRYYGTNPIIYCSTLFYEAYLKKDFPTNQYLLWIADYRGDPDHIDWHLWQHTERHTLSGVSGEIDRNIFGGTERQLRKLMLR